jgi:hypothetical protein
MSRKRTFGPFFPPFAALLAGFAFDTGFSAFSVFALDVGFSAFDAGFSAVFALFVPALRVVAPASDPERLRPVWVSCLATSPRSNNGRRRSTWHIDSRLRWGVWCSCGSGSGKESED